MAWYDDVLPLVRRNVSLADRTTFRIGGRAAYFMEPDDEPLFARAYACAAQSGLPVYLLGGGSNLLVSDEGIDGVVLSTLSLRGRIRTTGRARVRVRAGMGLAHVVNRATRMGLSGLEGLTGIPGTIGGAVRMNAGGRDGSIGERVSALWCADVGGEVFMRPAADVRWGYRGTNINDPILAVELKLHKDNPEHTRRRMRATLKSKRDSQPVDLPSAGCFFRNPPGDSAGRLIDQAGMKGFEIGMARVSRVHANFIVNMGGARASDVLGLRDAVRSRVRNAFGVVLENEVCYWPNAALD